MRCLVTGAAGFIGSHLTQALLEEGYTVLGVDCFTDYYARELKEANLAPLEGRQGFDFISENLNSIDLPNLLREVDAVFHLAAQAGVRASWGQSFAVYTQNNIESTQKLLEAAKQTGIQKFVYASSSSVYGECLELPMRESSPTRPFSPYGVSKLAAEHLCSLYFMNYGVPTVSLRFFTVYGPGQRPDMAFHKFFRAIASDEPISVFGDGRQTRDFTYIDDIVQANIAALTLGQPGEVYNVGGGHRRTLKDLFPVFEKTSGRKLRVNWEAPQKGDVAHTSADIDKAARDLKYSPQTSLEAGLNREWQWIRELYA
jgi:nucleoside-diphosphate-sugar epimerase